MRNLYLQYFHQNGRWNDVLTSCGFYGRCDDLTQNWSTVFPDGFCREGKPLLSSLVNCKRIKNKAFKMLADGAVPLENEYGHELYVCTKCMRLSNRFHFNLESSSEKYEPDYRCTACKTLLSRVDVCFDSNDNARFIYKNQQVILWKCPKCGGDSLVHDGSYVMWD